MSLDGLITILIIFVVLFIVGSCSIGIYMSDQASKIRKEMNQEERKR